jgi:hypothetical protein
LLSALILCVRFREQLIPMRGPLAGSEDPSQILEDFHRKLLAMELEARQFGLDEINDPEEATLPSVIRKEEARTFIVRGIEEWVVHRKNIDKMFTRNVSNRDRRVDADSIANMMDTIVPTNAQFIEIITEELLEQIRREGVRARNKPVMDLQVEEIRAAAKPA